MKRSAALIIASLLIGAPTVNAQEQTPAPSSSPMADGSGAPSSAYSNEHQTNAEEFGKYLHQNPGIEGDLTRDPSLVRDKAYIEAHPKLKAYLDAHPKLAEEFRSHPSNFMNRVIRAEGGRGPY
jgi:hypothetical protein